MNLLSIPYKICCQFFLWLVFVISVFVDMYNGYIQHYFNTTPFFPALYKGFILVICLVVCLLNKWSTFFKCASLLLFIYVLTWTYWCVCEPYFDLTSELNYFIKFSFSYWVLAFLFGMKKYINNDEFLKLLTQYGVIAAFSIIVLFYLGLGVNSYGEIDSAYGFGTKGFFTAGNDIGLVLLLTNCLLCYLYLSTHKIYYLIKIIVVTIATIMLGTMAGIGGSIIVWIMLIYFILFSSKIFLTRGKKIFMFLGMFVLLSYIVYNVFYLFSEDSYMLERFYVLLAGGSRTSLKEAAEQVFEGFNIIQWGLGKGYTGFGRSVALIRNVEGYRLTEMDMHDLIGYYGIIIGGVVLFFSFYVLYITFCRYIKYKLPINFWGIIAVCLFIGHGYFAGHAYSSTQSSLLFVGIAFIILSTKNEQLVLVNNNSYL
ncbi:O-antigen ligase family protein [Butyricimonas synergistica]|uniref:O-antigen ligase family protein n=1 Tax=Butyricimonas synergistica TaxID=544644 RepID=UPI00036F37F0|nr:O-antigen ligase family protein [Butyricimonas synergistica]